MALINFFSVYVCAEITALTVALFTLWDKRKSFWLLFIPLLLLIIAVEAVGYYRHETGKPNHIYYNLLMIIQELFFSLLFFRFFQSRKIKMWVLISLGLFMVFYISEAFLVSFSKYNGYSRMLLSGQVVVFSCIFYFSIIKDDSITSPVKYPPFWVVTGLFFFYFGSLPMFAFIQQVSKIKLAGNISFYTLVMGCLSCILYGSWIIGFICRKKQVQ